MGDLDHLIDALTAHDQEIKLENLLHDGPQ